MQAVVSATNDRAPSLCADIEPDLKVRAAMNEINAAQRLRRADRHAMIAPLSKSSAWLCLCPTHLADGLLSDHGAIYAGLMP